MASIQRDKSDNVTIQFTGPDKRRRTIRLGKMSERNVSRFDEKLEQLLIAAKHGTPLDADTAAWVSTKLSDEQADKLATYGLIPKREVGILGPFLDAYKTLRADVKGTTATVYGHTIRNLKSFFGVNKPLREVTAGDADEFRLNLLAPKAKKVGGQRIGKGGEGLAEATARRRCTLASQFFRAAQRKGLLSSNPFEGIGGAVKSNKARMYFISREEAAKVLEACPDDEWRLIFALSRFAGLRTPSEHNALRWADVDLPRGRFLVHSPKTEHHDGGDERWVPIFPELRPLLEAAWDRAPGVDPSATPAEKEAASYVLQRYRLQANLRTRFRKIIKRAGLTPWPKLFHNLRSTRQTELTAEFPIHVVCAWLGNKAAIAAEHYLQVTDADFDAAGLAKPMQRAANALHSGAISGSLECSGQNQNAANERPRVLLTAADSAAESVLVGGEGLEPIAHSTAKTTHSEKGAASALRSEGKEAGRGGDCRNDSGAASGGDLPSSRKLSGGAGQAVDDLPADLARVVNEWPNLTAETRAAVLGLIDRQAAAD